MRFMTMKGTRVESPSVVEEVGVNGAVLFAEAALLEFGEFLGTWTEPYSHPHDSQPGITQIAPIEGASAEAGTLGFTHQSLSPHTDRSTTEQPPSILATLVSKEAAQGGESLLLDGAGLLRKLRN